MTIPNASDLAVTWWKSSASGAQGDCVECGLLGDAVAVRDSKQLAGPALVFDRDALAAMVRAVADGTL